MEKLKKLFALSAISLMALSACAPVEEVEGDMEDNGETEETSTSEEGPIRIGSLLPLTGDAAAYGDPMQKVTQIAVDEVNANGGINGRQLEVIWEDAKCNGQDSSAAMQKLVNVDGVSVVYGGFCSSETLAAAPIAESNQVLLFSCGSSSPDVTNAGDFVFRNYPSDSSQGKITAEIATNLGFAKIAFLTEENDYTLGIEDAFSANFGGEVVSEKFLPTDTDFKTQITKVKAAGADAIFINPQTPPKADLIFKQLSELGTEAQLFGNDVVMSHKDGHALYTELTDGMLGAETSYNSEHPGYAHLAAEYKARHSADNIPFVTYAATCYDGIHVLAEGMAEVGTDAGALRDWLYALEGRDSVAGTLSIDSNGDPMSGHIPKVIQNGESAAYEM